jgi:hypothetical protein
MSKYPLARVRRCACHFQAIKSRIRAGLSSGNACVKNAFKQAAGCKYFVPIMPQYTAPARLAGLYCAKIRQEYAESKKAPGNPAANLVAGEI